MSELYNQVLKTLLPGMAVPEPLQKLFDWIEREGLFIDTEGGRIGFLFPEADLKASWTERERQGGTNIEFFAEGNINLEYWFGHKKPEVMNRLCVFAKTGAEGSMAAFWLDDDGQQRIVHLGSGSGSTLVCVLADDPVDFLRLIAIGYDEICWNEMFDRPPNDEERSDGFLVHPNIAFQAWVRETFSVTIPRTASEIVKHPSEMGDTESQDPFCQWVEKQTGA